MELRVWLLHFLVYLETSVRTTCFIKKPTLIHFFLLYFEINFLFENVIRLHDRLCICHILYRLKQNDKNITLTKPWKTRCLYFIVYVPYFILLFSPQLNGSWFHYLWLENLGSLWDLEKSSSILESSSFGGRVGSSTSPFMYHLVGLKSFSLYIYS